MIVLQETQLGAVFVFLKVLPTTVSKQTKLRRQVLEGHHQESLHFVWKVFVSCVWSLCFYQKNLNEMLQHLAGVFLLDILKPFFHEQG